MIRLLTGTLKEVVDGAVILDVNGVGYAILCPTTTPGLVTGSTITLHTYLAVRETALDLYGFREPEELRMFELLLGVPKVGPKSAWQIMNQATPALLVEAAQKNDPGYLQKLSGIGKKTCENIVQHLAQKVEHLPSVGATHTELSATQTDAIDALISLGYDATAAREIVLEISTPDATVNSIITVALKRIT